MASDVKLARLALDAAELQLLENLSVIETTKQILAVLNTQNAERRSTWLQARLAYLKAKRA